MKTTQYTLLAAALLLAASCANDPVEDIINPSVPGAALPGGTFVIDYTAGMEGADTRNDLPANQRIQSLDYLIYQSDSENGTYTLLKKRPIPDINTNTTWPLTRKDMTWAQREDLKDTLSTDKYYKMVFVANADDKIWNKEGTPEESMFHALQNVVVGTSTYEQGRLVLPPRVFKEDDMYYMWSNSENPLNGNDYTDNKTASQKIVLKRMINKVEVKLDASYPTEEDIEKYLDEYLNNELKQEGIIYNNVQTEMNTLVKDISNLGMPQAINNFKEYVKSDAQIDRLLGSTDEHSFRNLFIEAFKTHMKNEEHIIKKIKWDEVTSIEITYNSGGRASSIDFSRKSIAATDSDKDPILYKMDKENKLFCFYSYGNNAGDNSLNEFLNFSFKDENGNEIFNLSGVGIPQNIPDEGNHYIQITCDPLTKISSDKNASYTATINFDTFVAWDDIRASTLVQNLKSRVQGTLGNLEDVELTFNYPCNPVIKWEMNVIMN